MFHVQCALIVEKMTLVETEPFSIHKQLNKCPIGSVCQFFFRDGNGVKNTIEQGRGIRLRVALFKCATCAEVAVANGIDALLTVELLRCRVKGLFANLPKVHKSLLPQNVLVRLEWAPTFIHLSSCLT